jgi:Lysylphosphatidylglycerol synthase TM region
LSRGRVSATLEALEPDKKSRARWKAIVPWLVALLILAWLFHIVPIDDLRAALGRANLGLFAAFVFAAVSFTLLMDSLAIWRTARWALPDVPIRYRDTLEIRGASYLLGVLHYGVGQGGFAYFLHRRYGVEISRAAGVTMLVLGVNVILIALAAFVGVALGGAPDTPTLRWLVLGLAACFPGYFAVIALRPGFLTRWKLLRPIFDAGIRGHLVAVATRAPHVCWLIFANYLALRFFAVDPPIGKALALLPLVLVVATLPISPSGLGTAQLTAMALFAPYAAGLTEDDRRAAVLAASLSLQFLALGAQVVLGAFFLRRLSRRLAEESPATQEPKP